MACQHTAIFVHEIKPNLGETDKQVSTWLALQHNVMHDL